MRKSNPLLLKNKDDLIIDRERNRSRTYSALLQQYGTNYIEEYLIHYANSDCFKFKRHFSHWEIADDCNIQPSFLKKKATEYYDIIYQQLTSDEINANSQGVNYTIPNFELYIRSKVNQCLNKDRKLERLPECGTSSINLCSKLFEVKYKDLDKLKLIIYSLFKGHYHKYREAFDMIPLDQYGNFDENGFHLFVKGIYAHVKNSLTKSENNAISKNGYHDILYFDSYVRKIINAYLSNICHHSQQRRRRLVNPQDIKYFIKWLDLPHFTIEYLEYIVNNPKSVDSDNLLRRIRGLPGYKSASFSKTKNRIYISLNYSDRIDMINYLSIPRWDPGSKWNRNTSTSNMSVNSGSSDYDEHEEIF